MVDTRRMKQSAVSNKNKKTKEGNTLRDDSLSSFWDSGYMQGTTEAPYESPVAKPDEKVVTREQKLQAIKNKIIAERSKMTMEERMQSSPVLKNAMEQYQAVEVTYKVDKLLDDIDN